MSETEHLFLCLRAINISFFVNQLTQIKVWYLHFSIGLLTFFLIFRQKISTTCVTQIKIFENLLPLSLLMMWGFFTNGFILSCKVFLLFIYMESNLLVFSLFDSLSHTWEKFSSFPTYKEIYACFLQYFNGFIIQTNL